MIKKLGRFGVDLDGARLQPEVTLKRTSRKNPTPTPQFPIFSLKKILVVKHTY